MPTVTELIDRALAKFGAVAAGGQGTAEDHATGIANLQMMLDGWSLEGFMVPFDVTEQFALDPAQNFYGMGPDGDWDTVRPEEIKFVRVLDTGGNASLVRPGDKGLLSLQAKVEAGTPSLYATSRDARLMWVEFNAYPADHPYVLVTSRKPFNAVALDNLTEPWDDPEPETIYPSGFTMTGLQTPLEFPPGYELAIVYNLAIHLHTEYPGFDLPQTVVALAATSKARIKSANVSAPILQTEVAGMVRRRGVYNVLTGP